MTERKNWMTDSDETIIELLETGLTLTPSIISENTDLARGTVNRRLNPLVSSGKVIKVKRGKYRIAPDTTLENFEQ